MCEQHCVKLFDLVENEPCPNCKSLQWMVVDGEKLGEYILLCFSDNCSEFKPIPINVVVDPNY